MKRERAKTSREPRPEREREWEKFEFNLHDIDGSMIDGWMMGRRDVDR